MGWSIKKPLGDIGKRTGLSVPSIKRVSQNISKEAGRTWKNAKRGEIGRLVTGVAQSGYNVATAIPRAVVTGQYGREATKLVTSGINISTMGLTSYAGQSSGVQGVLRSSGVKQWTFGFSENVAGYTRGVSEGNVRGKIRQDDWINIYQGGAKIAAVVGAGLAYGAATAPAATPPPLGAEGTMLKGMTISQPAAYGPSTAELMAGSTAATPGPLAAAPAATTTATAAKTGLAAYLPSANTVGTTALLATVLKGGAPTPAMIGGMTGTDPAMWDTINNAIGRSPTRAPAAVVGGPEQAGFIATEDAAAGPSPVLLLGAVVAVGYLLKRRGVF